MSRMVGCGTALKVWLLAVLLVAGGVVSPAFAESVRDIIIDQTSVLERFTTPPTRPPRLGVTIDDRIAGVPAGELEGVRFVLRGVEFEGAETLDPALFAPLYSSLIGREITLAGIKRRTARAMDSGPLEAEASMTFLDGCLCIGILTALAVNILFGWWWADAVAALGIGAFAAKEGIESIREAAGERSVP